MALTLLYFAWVREGVGTGAEQVEPPAEVRTVAELVRWLRGRSEGHGIALAEPARLRAAIDQRFVPMEAEIAGAREIAIFPPVTGG